MITVEAIVFDQLLPNPASITNAVMLDALIAAIIWPAFDWLAVGRIANFYSNFEYRYWPLSASRAVSVVLMDAVVFGVIYVGPGQPEWLMLPFGTVWLYWGFVTMSDINRQHRLYVPPTVSDSKYGG